MPLTSPQERVDQRLNSWFDATCSFFGDCGSYLGITSSVLGAVESFLPDDNANQTSKFWLGLSQTVLMGASVIWSTATVSYTYCRILNLRTNEGGGVKAKEYFKPLGLCCCGLIPFALSLIGNLTTGIFQKTATLAASITGIVYGTSEQIVSNRYNTLHDDIERNHIDFLSIHAKDLNTHYPDGEIRECLTRIDTCKSNFVEKELERIEVTRGKIVTKSLGT